MMQAIFDMFNERINEIDFYFDALSVLENERDARVAEKNYYDDRFLKVLKANTLLMIYNLVESTVMGGILEIYDKLKQEGHTYTSVRKEIRDIWFAYKFHQVYDPNSHFNSYKSKALEIVNSILMGEVIELDRKATAINGNLDAKQIRSVCKEHGISFSVDEKCHGGAVLETVKERRNDLAHGTLSFSECGREYSIQDLVDIKNETVLFLQGLLRGMKEYYEAKAYSCSV